MTKNVLLFAIFFCLTLKTFAQETLPDTTKSTTSPKTKMDADSTNDETQFDSTEEREKLPEWYYSVSLDGTASSGNVNRQLLNFKTTLNFETKKHIFGFYTSPKFQFGTNADILQEREIFLDLNTTLFYLQSDVYGLAFGTFEQSNIRKINTRYNIGFGVGWKILGGKKTPKSRLKLSISNALVRELVDFESKQDRDNYRNSTRIKVKYDIIPDKLTFHGVVFLQPSLKDDYYRWNSSSQLAYKVGKHISILFSFENTYENLNSLGIKNAQTNATIGLTYSGSN
jgi:Protein of unknown function, DUF481